jgi:zinc transporter ZupT
MTATILQVSLLAFLSTSLGGLCAFALRDRLPQVLGFVAGTLLGVACFELLPESFALSRRLGGDGRVALVAPLVAFLLFHGLDRLALVRRRRIVGEGQDHHSHAGVRSAAALVGHSLIDGVGIGLAFQVSPTVGLTVAAAVVAHDFCDGLATVSLMLKHGGRKPRALGMLALDAAAPLVGAGSTFAFDIPAEALAPYLGCFAGLLLYVGASAIAPPARDLGWRKRIGPPALGALLVFLLAHAAG